MVLIAAPTPDSIARAANVLTSGGLLGLPTETVYGLGANALDGVAVARIFEAKGRPAFNPLIVHVADASAAENYAEFSDEARMLAAVLWPGPLTMILPRKADCGISDLVTAGLNSIAIRVPAHKVARDILKAAGVPVAAPSANISGTLSPTTPQHVADGLGDKVDLIIGGGAAEFGLESTVIDMTGDMPVILRPGAVTPDDVARVLDVTPQIDDGDKGDAPKSPGQLLRHYAPRTKVRLGVLQPEAGEGYLAFGPCLIKGDHVKNLSEKSDLFEAAANLFNYLHIMDKGGFTGIAVAPIPDEGLGLAINNRLKRAAEA